MILCSIGCTPCCDYCKYAIHEEWDDNSLGHIVGGPIGCDLHKDQKHQDIAEGDGCCNDFHCFLHSDGFHDFSNMENKK